MSELADRLEDFINQEPEADAKICDAIAEPMYPHAQGPYLDCAKAIRSAE